MLASFRMMDSSQLCSLRVRLAGSATRIFSSWTPRSTMKCPDEVKCPADMMAMTKLNYLAALIDELSLSDQEKLVAIMEAGCDEVSDIDDLINLTFNLDCYDIMPGINDESDLGYYYAHEAGIYSEKDLGPLANYIDYERYGRDIAMDEQGRFTDEGYVRVASERWDRQFNGELDDIPDEYRITGTGEAAERDSTIAVLIVEPGKEPYMKEIDSGLESLQHEVGGCIEAIYPYEDPVALV